MNLFAKKTTNFPTEPIWSLLQGQHEGKPMFVRRNETVKKFWKTSGFSSRFGVATPFIHTNPEGFPTQEESDLLWEVEEDICNMFEKEQTSILVLVITLTDAREYVLYTCDPKACENTLITIRNKYPSREFQYYCVEDKNWELYKQFS